MQTSVLSNGVRQIDHVVATDYTRTTGPSSGILIELVGVGKRYIPEHQGPPALQSVDLAICAGEFVAIMGPSGSGKSTLLMAIAALNPISEGTVLIDGVDINDLSGDRQADYRNAYLGFIFQQHHLLPHLTAQENVLLAAAMNNPDGAALIAATSALERVGLHDKAHRLPGELSGGEQARVAIARCLMRNPPIVLADEPSGSLDSKTGAQVLDILSALNAEGHTVVMVTHSEEAAKRAGRVVRLCDGRIVSDERVVASCTVQPPLCACPPQALAALAGARRLYTGAKRTSGRIVDYAVGIALTLQVLIILYLVWEGLTGPVGH